MPLLWYLRDVLGLTGTKFGCGMALCGACTVHKNGEALRSCITPLSALAGAEMRTIEDISSNGLHPVQKMWMQFNVPQCGYCQSGQIMQARCAAEKPSQPTRISRRAWLAISAAARNLSAHSCRNQSCCGAERMNSITNVSRRGFIKGLVGAAGALVLGVHFVPKMIWPGHEGLPLTDADRAALHPNAFVGIETDSTVYVVAHRSEMGTAIRTSLPLVVADELDADWKRVKLTRRSEIADTVIRTLMAPIRSVAFSMRCGKRARPPV